VIPLQVAERIPSKIIWGLRRFLPPIPLPVCLPYRICWTATYPNGFDLWVVNIEKGERRFVAGFLRPGMTVLDLGAHHGLFTTLMSRLVGPSGRVLAFEPSPRERRGLERHIRLNACTNVTVVPMAVSSSAGNAEFYMVENRRSGASGLRRTQLDGRFPKSERIQVRVAALDEYLGNASINYVDFVKMDIEGAELEAFKGAKKLLTSTADRPSWSRWPIKSRGLGGTRLGRSMTCSLHGATTGMRFSPTGHWSHRRDEMNMMGFPIWSRNHLRRRELKPLREAAKPRYRAIRIR